MAINFALFLALAWSQPANVSVEATQQPQPAPVPPTEETAAEVPVQGGAQAVSVPPSSDAAASVPAATPPPSDPASGSTPSESASPAAVKDFDVPRVSYATKLGIGVVAGSTSGVGFTLRRHFDSRFGVAGGGLIFVGGDHRWWNIGVEGMYSILRGRRARFYGLFGAAMHTNVDSYDRDFSGKSDIYRKMVAILGPGLGVEVHGGRHFGWHIELPISMWINLNDASLPFGGDFNILPVPNTGFTFYF
jgi:hypothetical protein